jgi:hypothetical protein
MQAGRNENYSWVKSVNLEQRCNILEPSMPPSSFFNDAGLQNLGLLLWIDAAGCSRRFNIVQMRVFCIHCCDMIIQFTDNKYQVYSWVKYIGILIVILTSLSFSFPVCVNVTYLVHDYGISFTVTVNKHTIYNETVSGKYIFQRFWVCVCVCCKSAACSSNHVLPLTQ